MATRSAVATLLLTLATAGIHSQVPRQSAPVDFARDVQPILKTRCIGCHGSTKQESGYRLDRRSTAVRGLLRPHIIPGSSASSRLYNRISGTDFGQQMPPTGPLSEAEIDTIKRWIDEGAVWPDDLANEADPSPPDPDADRMIAAIQQGDRSSALDQLTESPTTVNRRGTGGSTPLMYAAVHGDVRLVSEMMEAGADPNVRNDAGATALMWAVENADIVRLLLGGGADANVVSGFGRTPLVLASSARSSAVVRLLLDSGAIPTTAALSAAAFKGDEAIVRMLLAAGAHDTGEAAIAALRANCRACLDAITSRGDGPPLRRALLALLPPAGPGNADAIREAIARGADVTLKDAKGRSVLMRAAIVNDISLDVVQALIARGATVRDVTPGGFTTLDAAVRTGNRALADVLTEAGGSSAKPYTPPSFDPIRANNVDDAVRRSLPLLQRSGRLFYQRGGCVSCHHTSLTQMTVAAARHAGYPLDEATARDDIATLVKDVRDTHDQAVQELVAPGGLATTTGYILMGLSAERHPRDSGTLSLVRLLRLAQRRDGAWTSAYRPPFEASEITATVVSMRGLQLYGSSEPTSADANAIRAAARWLENARPRDTEDLVFRLFGLTWAGAPVALRRDAMRDLVATQRADGGWSQLPALASDAYATGEALVALAEAGMRPTDSVYRRAVQFLLATQVADGSWHVRTRSLPTQAYFESGFPYGADQFISAAATNWATLALIRSQGPRVVETRRR